VCTASEEKRKHQYNKRIISSLCDTDVEPNAMMVELENTSVANATMFGLGFHVETVKASVGDGMPNKHAPAPLTK
jgi:hypothetical protein